MSVKLTSRTPGRHQFGGLEVEHAGETVPKVARVPLAAAEGDGGVLAWLNPESSAILVHDVILDVTTEATGSATIDVGVAADGETSDDTLIDGGDIGAAAATLSSANAPGTNGGSHRRVEAGEYVTGTASADPAGLEGTARIIYSRL